MYTVYSQYILFLIDLLRGTLLSDRLLYAKVSLHLDIWKLNEMKHKSIFDSQVGDMD